ncbi:MAG: Fructose-6-phosphate aldolase 1 [Pseudomonadota bacterium]|jgi:transaldolase
MKLYLDSADAQQWTLPAGCPTVQGVTTNPTLVLQAGLPVSLAGYRRLVLAAGEYRLPELMLQLPRADAGEAADWLGQLLPLARQARLRLTIKLPCHPDWQAVLHEVQAWGVPTLLTGLSNPMQLLWAQQQGAHWVAPYVGRLQADGRDVWALIRACVAVQHQGPQLLAASIKSADVLAQLMAHGAVAATVRPDFAASLATDPLTLAAMAQFDADVQSSQSLG